MQDRSLEIVQNTSLEVVQNRSRGLASLVFTGTVVLESDTEFGGLIIGVAATTVGLSVLLHGISAWPASNRYARWYRRSEESNPEPMVEGTQVPMVPHRRPGDISGMAE